jgi:hypothetical protein
VSDQPDAASSAANAKLGQGWLSPSFSTTDRVELMGGPLGVMYR